MPRSFPQWDLDSDEIASVASDDLRDNRPNRWTGSEATWRRMTVEERRLWRSMKMLEDEDLAAHLYNAFALKRRGRDAEAAQDLAVTMENGQQGIWAPPRVWTAWPLNHGRVPEQRLLRGEDDEDDKYTIRKAEQRMPSSELQEELAATVLRLARERFHRWRKPVLASIEEDAAAAASPMEASQGSMPSDSSSSASLSADEMEMRSGNVSQSDKMAVDEEVDDAEDDEEDEDGGRGDMVSQPRGKKRAAPETYDPVMSTNDELSYELIKQSVRHIISQMDTALTILHNARVATADYASDSSATDEDSDSHHHHHHQPGPKRGRGRPRSTPQVGGDFDSSPQPGVTPPPPPGPPAATTRKRGRPRKVHLPRDGETHEEMLIRVARQSHRRLPATSQDRDAAFEEWLRRGDERIAREKARLREDEELGIEPGASAQERRVRKLGLRDWSEVLGAAALAGFSGDVVARTAKRCAGLFGEGMVVRRLDEVPAAREPAFHSLEYRPEKIQLSELEDDEEDNDISYRIGGGDADDESETTTSQRRTISRTASFTPFSRGPSSSPFRGRSSPHSHSPRPPRRQQRQSQPRRCSRSHSQSRSRSRSSAGFFLCPVPSCERAATGFSRRQNLKRHMQLVHPGRAEGEEDDGAGAGGVGREEGEEGDSEDEVFGAVHVDGFLKPIFPARGWRENPSASSQREREKQRQRQQQTASQSRETSPKDTEESSSSS